MISIRFHLRPSTRTGRHPGRIFIRIIHKRQTSTITTPYSIYPEDWDDRTGCIRLITGDAEKYDRLMDLNFRLKKDMTSLRNYAAELEQEERLLPGRLREFYLTKDRNCRLINYAYRLAGELEAIGRERTARAYLTSARKIVHFFDEPRFSIKRLNRFNLKKFEEYLRSENCSLNTISFYMRNLRAIYNKAVTEGLVEKSPDNPFRDVYTGIQITRKRALTKEDIHQLKVLENKVKRNGETGRDPARTDSTVTHKNDKKTLDHNLENALRLFMFCFHARGMSFVDMAYLRKENVVNGIISYIRKKTGQRIEITVTPILRTIMESFAHLTARSPYVFPIIDPAKGCQRRQYESALRLQNIRLDKLKRMAGIDKKLTTHVARHSWATIGKYEKLPLWVISEGLGHSSEKMTYTYLASFERSVIDKASEKIYRAVNGAV